MIRKVLHIHLKEPILIRDKKGVGNVLQSKGYIPGTTLRGALAFAYLSMNGKSANDENFREFFLANKIRYGHAYPAKTGKNYRSLPIPATARSCKYNPGFIVNPFIQKDDPHGVMDILFPWVFYLLNEKNNIDFPHQYRKCLPDRWNLNIHCEAPLEPFEGFYLINGTNNYERIEIKKRLVQRTAINEWTQTAWANKLYSIEFIERGQEFISEMLIDDSLLKDFEQFINDKSEIFIGGKKNIASGRVNIELKDPTPFPNREELEQRFRNMDKAFTDFCQKYGTNSGNKFTFFTITLQSDTIIQDKWFRYKNFIDIDDLKSAVKNEDPSILDNFKLFHAWINTDTVAGWNLAP
ncbi:MAG: hypothetical protein GXO78_06930, partial [Calditrichaeota bacterium]|nr:hypothetical protein [Calditrichota bacterium]